MFFTFNCENDRMSRACSQQQKVLRKKFVKKDR
ncbi:unnamed protein product [Nezara viridula]|uniref:Uncharacterized protein n=1 Tax=Nezara viridula TaxID=85310 RepID=A0A9P0HP32_NEZVI|nr:unnamed protein product [Nezara viridula]